MAAVRPKERAQGPIAPARRFCCRVRGGLLHAAVGDHLCDVCHHVADLPSIHAVHAQLDEIKNVLLMTLTPVLLAAAVFYTDFNRMTWRHACHDVPARAVCVLTMVISYIIHPYKAIAERVVWFQVGCATFTVVYAWYTDSENKMRKIMMFQVLLALASVCHWACSSSRGGISPRQSTSR